MTYGTRGAYLSTAILLIGAATTGCGSGSGRATGGEGIGALGGRGGFATGGIGGSAGSGGLAGSGGFATGGIGGSAGSGGLAGSTGRGGLGASAGSAGLGGSAGAGAGGASQCDTSSNACIPLVPADWSGPVAFFHGSGSVPACPGGFPAKEAEQHAVLDEGSAVCTCTCGGATGINCAGSARVCPGTQCPSQTTQTSCGTSGTLIGPNDCVAGTYPQGVWNIDVPTATGGSCAPIANNTLPTPVWGESTVRCGGAAPVPGTDCAAGTACLPSVPSPFRTCIWRPGDQACPTAFYSQKTLAYDGFRDTRACSTCGCGAPTNERCGNVIFQDQSQCFSNWSLGSGDECTSTGGPATAVWYDEHPTGSCTPSGGTLSGGVTKIGEITYCCAQ